MKTIFKLLPVATLVLAACASQSVQQPELGAKNLPILELNDLRFKDFNRNGKLEPFEDWRNSPEQRAKDLTARLSIEQKVGLMFHSTLPNKKDSSTEYDLVELKNLVQTKHVNHLITRLATTPANFAEQNNLAQQVAEQTEFAIPLSVSSDPRHHFLRVAGTPVNEGFSKWPETLGFAALNDPQLTKQFGQIAGKEYRAVGIQVALSPQADLATEPRWSRVTSTFGSNPDVVSQQVGAYIEGFQQGNQGVNPQSVATIVKHWVGYGAEPNGYDGHNYYGRNAQHTADSFALHVKAFDGAFTASTAGVMPTYPILNGATVNGQPLEKVGAGYSKQLLTDLLRNQKGFKGIILSDWGITRDCTSQCTNPTKANPQTLKQVAMPWGVENLTVQQRYVKALNAGLDQFGGTDNVEPLQSAVKNGEISEQRLAQSVQRILEQKFALGLFENPYVDVTATATVFNNAETKALAHQAQQQAQVLLENNGLMPVQSGKKVYLHNVDATIAKQYGFTVVKKLSQADFAIVRLETPFEYPHSEFYFGSLQHEGRLNFLASDKDYQVVQSLAKAHVPTIVSVYMDRPAILTNIKDKAAVLMVNFGADDNALFDVVTGKAKAQGKLPFELPRSMQAVEKQHPALPDDSENPLYPYGYSFN